MLAEASVHAAGGQLERPVSRGVEPKRPLLRYHGGKWKLAPWILRHLPAHRTYVEPFGGGASVLLQKPRSHAEVYNDLDGDIVNFFRVLRDQQQRARLIEALTLTPYARDAPTRSSEPPAHSSKGPRDGREQQARASRAPFFVNRQ